MRLSKQGEYGLRAMLYLAAHEEQGRLRSKVIAQKEGISVKFLEQILARLRKAGLLKSQKGVGGGYELARPADQINLAEISRAIDGPLAPMGNKEQLTAMIEQSDQHCGLYKVLMEVRDAVADVLENTTLADVTQRTAQCQQEKKGMVYHI